MAVSTVAHAGANRPWIILHTRASRGLMTKLLGFVGATVGGYAGWALGALAGTFMAFVVSMIGTGFGLYWGRRIAQNIGS
jgi:uncharacterized membrane protein YeaQ/YmgE (transglycosylase-associated protein family)